MFTGLIEAIGAVRHIQQLGEQAKLSLDLPFRDELTLGDSVAINGCCLTVSRFAEDAVEFDLLEQTLRVTALGSLTAGSRVNLERAMILGGRMGGHLVQGHVDGVGIIEKIEARGQDHIIHVRLPHEIATLCIEKGSLAVDGISLTIAELAETLATFWITPHTWQMTHLAHTREQSQVNLEADMLAKMVYQFMTARQLTPAKDA